ncbi:hypothetical protein Q31b_10710 [Novipirellula aureliae]|uniref:Uncharacterized protein n=1 Tax=Novipirellula aureliae TaxID=2527966 RepID=A0A5C6EBN4_9BACT|nr:hypothetical protein [Novipirellula aureliae]TWU45895.1 hypothetical protein Q31b_10710 [Novipirellula aureliae]
MENTFWKMEKSMDAQKLARANDLMKSICSDPDMILDPDGGIQSALYG